MKPWIRKTILALALVIVGMVGVALWKPAYLFWAAAAIAPDLTAKMVVKWSLYRKELIAKSFSPEEQKKNLEEQTIRIELGRGDCSETIWTTDLSHEYVRINAEYRS